MNPAAFSETIGGLFFELGGWEVVLILAALLAWIGAGHLSDLARRMRQDDVNFLEAVRGIIFEALTPNNQTCEVRHKEPLDEPEQELKFNLTLWLAQGFGAGRIRFAPGTFGSAVGLLWFFLLLLTGQFWLYLAGAVLGAGLSVWLCGAAEIILRQKDPPSVVLDEISAIPFCFLPWVAGEWLRKHSLPSPQFFLNADTWLTTAAIFFLFRVFDIAKPWPIRQSQELPGGWGVTVDDLLAAAYVALLTLAFVGK